MSHTPAAKGDQQLPRRSPRQRAAGVTSQLQQLRKAGRKQLQERRQDELLAAAEVSDPLQPCDEASRIVRGPTGLVYDELFLKHFNTWDPVHPESPQRLTAIYERCYSWGLVDRCVRVPARKATVSELQLCHSLQYINSIRELCQSADARQMELFSEPHDIYLNTETFVAASMAVGSAIDLVDRILDGKLQNAFLMARPPGHHAMRETPSGYCVFNQTAVAARHALTRNRRVLIVDWDVHYGQGTQMEFHDEDRVLCFSVHRYERGQFWPHLPEADYDYLGSGRGRGYTCNVPLNLEQASDADLLAVWHRLLLPMAYEFAPDLVIVSAGYDIALGDPKGEMCVTPAAFGALTHALCAVAGGRLLAVLEGGYNTSATALGAAHTLRVMLGDPPALLTALSAAHQPPHPSVEHVIYNAICSHRPYFRCFESLYPGYSVSGAPAIPHTFPRQERSLDDGAWHHVAAVGADVSGQLLHTPLLRRFDQLDEAARFTRDEALDRLQRLAIEPLPRSRDQLPVLLISNDGMMAHRNICDPEHPECPERLSSILRQLDEWELSERCRRITTSRLATHDELATLHESAHIRRMRDTADVPQNELNAIARGHNSVYLCPHSYKTALLAAGCVIEAVDSVLTGDGGSAVCVVRPPGHHAESDCPHGFCLFNNVALAARHACHLHQLQRVLIVDWDIHHGNGIQHMFYEDRRVLYVSLHRYDHGGFFPCSDDAAATRCGDGDGLGYNVNVPWNRSRMSGADYLATWLNVVLPVARQYRPQLVLVSAGFDAARGDPLGGYRVEPEVYGHLVYHLSALAEGRLVLALEGGYNLTSIAYSMAMCVKALLGDPLVQLEPMGSAADPLKPSAVQTLRDVMRVQHEHWPAVALPKALPEHSLDVLQRLQDLKETGRDSEDVGRGDAAAVASDAPVDIEVVSRMLDAVRIAGDDASTSASSGPCCNFGTRDTHEPSLDLPRESLRSPASPGEQSRNQHSFKVDEASSKDIPTSCPLGESSEILSPPSAEGTTASLSRDNAAASMTSSLISGGDCGTRKSSTDGILEESMKADILEESMKADILEESMKADILEESMKADILEESAMVGVLEESKAADSNVDCSSNGAIAGALMREQLEFEAMYAVIPLSECPHLVLVEALPASGINAAASCLQCGDSQENWVCLTCYQVYCGRYAAGHMVEHDLRSQHCMVLSLSDLSVWCYQCESYVHNPVLIPAKRAAHRSKFGTDMPH